MHLTRIVLGDASVSSSTLNHVRGRTRSMAGKPAPA
jgi:hypothetical protein